MATTRMYGVAKIYFRPQKLYFSPDDVTTGPIAQKYISENGLYFFHNSLYIIGSRKTQYYGDHAHVWGTKKIIFGLKSSIFPLMTSQRALLLKSSISENGLYFFHNSLYIIGSRKTQYYGDHAHVWGTKNLFSASKALFFP